MRRAAIALLCASALGLGALPGCGDDDEDAPTISVPTETIETLPTTTTETGETTGTTGGTGTTTGTAPSTGKPDPSKPDGPANDLPPAPGSPEEAFEQACKQNPAACG